MKILLITFSDNADHQDTLFGLYEELVKTSDVYLMCINHPKVPLKKSNRTWLVDCPKRPGITKKTFDIKLLFSLIKKIKTNKFDVIYFESLHVWNLPIMIMCKNAHIYQVIHEVIPHEGDSQVKMVDIMNKVVSKLANTIVLRNRKYIPDMITKYNISSNKVYFLEFWRRYPGFTEPTFSKRVLFFGRINPYKGAGNLIQIAQKCSDIQFDVVGRIDTQMESIVEEIKELPNVKITNGYVSNDDMKNAFVNCDWVILPYNSASQSGVIIDAYKYSRPVISFDVGAISEQIDEGKSGYLIEPGNINHFVQVLQQCVNMKKQDYYIMCENAYEYGSNKYSAIGAVERFKKLLRETYDNY